MNLTKEDFQRIKDQYQAVKAAKKAVYDNEESTVAQLNEASMIYGGNAIGFLEFILLNECPTEQAPQS